MAPTLTTDDKETRERKAAEVLANVAKLIETDLPGATARIAALETTFKQFEGIDVRKVVDTLAELRAAQEQVAKDIRDGKRGGMHIAGLGDDAKAKFSLLNVMRVYKLERGLLTKQAFERHGAGYEFEVLHAYQRKYEADYRAMGLFARSQQIGDEELGGAFVPDQVLADIIGPIWTASVIVSLGPTGTTRARLIDGLTGGEVKIPQYKNGMTATWLGEDEASTETHGTFGSIALKPKKCGAHMVLTEDMLRMGGMGFETFLRADLTQAVAKLVDRAMLYGKGTKDPLGVFNTPSVKVFRAETSKVYDDGDAVRNEGGSPDWAGGELDFTKLDLMRVALQRYDVEMGPSWATISCPDYFFRLRNTKVSMFSGQTSEQTFLFGPPLISEAALRGAIGDFGRSTQVPFSNKPGASIQAPTTSTTAKFTDVLQGNMDQIVVARWSGTEITDDGGRGTGFLSDLTNVKIRQRIDGRVRQVKELIICPDARAIA